MAGYSDCTETCITSFKTHFVLLMDIWEKVGLVPSRNLRCKSIWLEGWLWRERCWWGGGGGDVEDVQDLFRTSLEEYMHLRALRLLTSFLEGNEELSVFTE